MGSFMNPRDDILLTMGNGTGLRPERYGEQAMHTCSAFVRLTRLI